MFSGIETDVLGEHSVVEVDPRLYDEAVIFKTAYWFTDRFYLYLSRADSKKISVEIRPKKSGDHSELKTACADFCNALIDFRVRQQVLAETLPIREALLAKAFAEGGRDLGLSGVASNEDRLPKAGDDYRDDPAGAGVG